MTVQTDAQWQGTLRLAVGTTTAFVLCEAMQWAPSFLAAALTVALLANIPVRPPLKVAIGLLVSMVFAAAVSFLVATWFRLTPTILFGVLAVCVFVAYYRMLGARTPLPALLMLICLGTVPVITLASPSAATFLPIALVRGMALALVVIALVWLPWPLFTPPPPKATPAAPTQAPPSPFVLALLATAVILPLMLVYLLFALADVLPVMIATVMLVASFDPRKGRAQAVAFIAGNFAGGFLGMVLHVALSMAPSLVTLSILVFVAVLWFGARISAGGPSAPVYVIACNAMLIILGSAIADGPGSLSLWLVRLFQFTLAGVFAVAMMEVAWHGVLGPRRRAQPQ